MKTWELTCPNCGETNDAQTAADGTDHDPTDGDVSICLYCCQPGIFADGAIRVATAAELNRLLRNPDYLAAVIAIRSYQESRS